MDDRKGQAGKSDIKAARQRCHPGPRVSVEVPIGMGEPRG